MANIGEIARELAAKIVYQLNQKDSNSNDNCIDANIWKQYAVKKYGAKDNVKVKISVFNAENSIEKYIKTQSQATGKSVSEIGEKWYNDLVEIKEKPKQETICPDVTLYKEKNDATEVSKINIPEAQTIRKGERPALAKILGTKTKTLDDCKKSAELHIKQELDRRGLTKTDAEIEYWSDKIGYMAYKYDMPEEILISIIGRENKFDKNKSNGNGSGAMALTTVAIEDMFPNKHWSETYKMLDENLHKDIFYKNNAKGEPILQYSDSASVRKACSKDDVSIKVGTLYFEMCYVKALTAEIRHKEYRKVTQSEVEDTIKKLRVGAIDFSKINNENVVATALLNYNGHSKHMQNYRRDTMDSLRTQGFNFKQQIIVAKS